MKKIVLILLLIASIAKGQTYPINEPFNSVAAWTCVNGSGLQTYGAGLNYLTTNIGNIPYPNSSTISMTSPVYSFTNCVGVLSLTFPISGRIENGYDFMYFEYSTNGGATWITAATHTGIRNNVYNYTLSNNINRFRFRLVTDVSVNTYNGGTSVYYYDIDYFNITCTNALPIELVYFKGLNVNCNENELFWSTASEINNDYFNVERSDDGVNFTTIKQVDGHGTSVETNNYSLIDQTSINGINYYRLTQVDFDGESKSSPIISIDNSCNKSVTTLKILNLLGQEVDESYSGVIFMYRSDNTILKRLQYEN